MHRGVTGAEPARAVCAAMAAFRLSMRRWYCAFWSALSVWSRCRYVSSAWTASARLPSSSFARATLSSSSGFVQSSLYASTKLWIADP